MQPFLSMIGLRPKPLSDGPRYGKPYDRCMASAIDIVILFLLLHRLTSFVTDKTYAFFGQLSPTAGPAVSNFSELAEIIWQARYPWFISNSVTVLMMGMVYVAFQMAYATTPGKWLLGLRILDAKTLEPIQGWRYAWRYLAYIPSAFPLMLGVIWASFNTRHRAWHDYLAGTVVIYTRPQGWYWQQVKRGFHWLRAKLFGSRPMEEPMREPPAEQRHENGPKPIE